MESSGAFLYLYIICIRHSIRPLRQNLTPKPQLSHHFPCAKKNLCVYLQRLTTIVIYPGEQRLLLSTDCVGFFMPIILHTWRLPFRNFEFALRVETSLLTSGMCSRHFCISGPADPGMVNNDAICNRHQQSRRRKLSARRQTRFWRT